MTLRVRLLLGLVVLAAIGLTVAGGVTYRQTRADLLGRVNQQLATSSQSPNLFFHGFDRSDENLTHALLPPGTWAQVRASGSGQILDTNPGVVSGASPALPATVKPGQIFTVDSPHYRVRAAQPRLYLVQDPSLGVQRGVQAFMIVAIPLADVDHTLHHLFLVEIVVVLAVRSEAHTSELQSL